MHALITRLSVFGTYTVRMNIDELLFIACVLKCKKTKTPGKPQHAGCMLCSDRGVYYYYRCGD